VERQLTGEDALSQWRLKEEFALGEAQLVEIVDRIAVVEKTAIGRHAGQKVSWHEGLQNGFQSEMRLGMVQEKQMTGNTNIFDL